MIEISIKEIEDSIKNVFKDAEVLNTDSVYEKIDNSDNLKMVLFINKLLDKDISILYTKLIFVVNKEKTKLINNSFMYLYDINCNYSNIEFSDVQDFETKLKNIIENKKFGNDLKVLSTFVENPAFSINDWFGKNKITDVSITNVKYDPKMFIMPCKSLQFSFEISVNNIEVNFTLIKYNDTSYKYTFQINDDIINIEKPNLNTLIETIGTVLKNKLK